MQLGMIGLGRMGSNMVRRLLRGRQECVVYDVHASAAAPLVGEGAEGAASLDEFVKKLKPPRRLADGPGRRSSIRRSINLPAGSRREIS